MAFDAQGNDLNIDYTNSYSPLNRSGEETDFGTNIMGASDKAYLAALNAAAKATPTSGDTTNADYYPDTSEVIRGQMSMGTGLPTMNLIAPSALYPFAALDKNQSQLELAKAAEENLYLKGLQYDYTQLKDSIKNEVWLPTQASLYEEGRQKYVDKYGEVAGTKAFRMSNDYKLLTMKLNNYSKAFNNYYDEAAKMVTEYQTQGTLGKDKTGIADHYISEDAYNAASDFLKSYAKEGTTLDSLDEINNANIKFQKAVGIIKGITPIAEGLSQDVTTLVNQKYGGTDLSTDKQKIYTIETITGVTDEYLDTKMPSGKTVAKMYYDQIYGNIATANKPDFEDWKQNLKDQILYKQETKLDKADKMSPLDWINYQKAKKEVDADAEFTRTNIKDAKGTTFTKWKGTSSKIFGTKTKNVEYPEVDMINITALAKNKNNQINFVGGRVVDLATGEEKKVDAGTYDISNIIIDPETGTKKMIISQPYYTKQTIDGKTDYVENPKFGDDYVVDYDTGEDVIKNNFPSIAKKVTNYVPTGTTTTTKSYTYKGVTYTEAELKSGGWTDEQIAKHATPVQ